MVDLPFHALMEQVLPFRSAKYCEDFVEKLLGEGIANPSDLLGASKDALEMKLSTHASFNFIEMADAIALRQSMVPGKPTERKPEARKRSPKRRGRSRSNGKRGRKGNRDFSGGRGGGQRNNSRPHHNNNKNSRNNSQNGRQQSSDNRMEKEKPELWAAVENNDEGRVQQLLAQGADAEERFEGWTPLMKASEDGAVQVMRLLLAKKVDIEASNKKGRTALSFAASPSFNSKLAIERDTPVEALRLLLESGADAKRKDARGNTAKCFASKQKGREDSLAVFEEFGF